MMDFNTSRSLLEQILFDRRTHTQFERRAKIQLKKREDEANETTELNN